MDGVIVAYHNTERMFGFQYVPLEEMDQRLFGPQPGAGELVFEKSISILELVADEIVLCFPKQVWSCSSQRPLFSRCSSLSGVHLRLKKTQAL
jgi:hypothetical protein